MAETALAALYRAVKGRLVGAGSETWGARVSPDLAQAGTERPHVVYGYAAGGEMNQNVKADAEIVLTVKAISLTQVEAFTLAARISTLLNDADRGTVRALDGAPDWIIVHSKQEQAVHLVEQVKDGVWIYHEGARFRFRMEAVA